MLIRIWNRMRELDNLLSAKWARGRSDTLEESLCIFLVCVANVLRRALVCRVESLRQLIQGVPYLTWEGVAEGFKLVAHPPEPT